jgi:hypothetical protein
MQAKGVLTADDESTALPRTVVPDEPVPDCVAQPGRGALVALGHAHNLFMVWTAVIPEWVVPAPMEVGRDSLSWPHRDGLKWLHQDQVSALL